MKTLPSFFVVNMKEEVFYHEDNLTRAVDIESFLERVVSGSVPSQSQGGGSFAKVKAMMTHPLALGIAVLAVVGVLVAVIPRNPGARAHDE